MLAGDYKEEIPDPMLNFDIGNDLDGVALLWLTQSVSNIDAAAVGVLALGGISPTSTLAMQICEPPKPELVRALENTLQIGASCGTVTIAECIRASCIIRGRGVWSGALGYFDFHSGTFEALQALHIATSTSRNPDLRLLATFWRRMVSSWSDEFQPDLSLEPSSSSSLWSTALLIMWSLDTYEARHIAIPAIIWLLSLCRFKADPHVDLPGRAQWVAAVHVLSNYDWARLYSCTDCTHATDTSRLVSAGSYLSNSGCLIVRLHHIVTHQEELGLDASTIALAKKLVARLLSTNDFRCGPSELDVCLTQARLTEIVTSNYLLSETVLGRAVDTITRALDFRDLSVCCPVGDRLMRHMLYIATQSPNVGDSTAVDLVKDAAWIYTEPWTSRVEHVGHIALQSHPTLADGSRSDVVTYLELVLGERRSENISMVVWKMAHTLLPTTRESFESYDWNVFRFLDFTATALCALIRERADMDELVSNFFIGQDLLKSLLRDFSNFVYGDPATVRTTRIRILRHCEELHPASLEQLSQGAAKDPVYANQREDLEDMIGEARRLGPCTECPSPAHRHASIETQE